MSGVKKRKYACMIGQITLFVSLLQKNIITYFNIIFTPNIETKSRKIRKKLKNQGVNRKKNS